MKSTTKSSPNHQRFLLIPGKTKQSPVKTNPRFVRSMHANTFFESQGHRLHLAPSSTFSTWLCHRPPSCYIIGDSVRPVSRLCVLHTLTFPSTSRKCTYFTCGNTALLRFKPLVAFPKSQSRKVVTSSKTRMTVRNTAQLYNKARISQATQVANDLRPYLPAPDKIILSLVGRVNHRLSQQSSRPKLLPTPSSSRQLRLPLETKVAAPQFPRKRFFYKKKKIATLNILSTLNNTLLTLSGFRGRVLKGGWASAGSQGFKNSRKSSTYAAQAAAKQLALRARKLGIRALYLKARGMGRAKGVVVRTLQKSSLRILVIRECTPIVHNGCRPAKKRRI